MDAASVLLHISASHGGGEKTAKIDGRNLLQISGGEKKTKIDGRSAGRRRARNYAAELAMAEEQRIHVRVDDGHEEGRLPHHQAYAALPSPSPSSQSTADSCYSFSSPADSVITASSSSSSSSAASADSSDPAIATSSAHPCSSNLRINCTKNSNNKPAVMEATKLLRLCELVPRKNLGSSRFTHGGSSSEGHTKQQQQKQQRSYCDQSLQTLAPILPPFPPHRHSLISVERNGSSPNPPLPSSRYRSQYAMDTRCVSSGRRRNRNDSNEEEVTNRLRHSYISAEDRHRAVMAASSLSSTTIPSSFASLQNLGSTGMSRPTRHKVRKDEASASAAVAAMAWPVCGVNDATKTAMANHVQRKARRTGATEKSTIAPNSPLNATSNAATMKPAPIPEVYCPASNVSAATTVAIAANLHRHRRGLASSVAPPPFPVAPPAFAAVSRVPSLLLMPKRGRGKIEQRSVVPQQPPLSLSASARCIPSDNPPSSCSRSAAAVVPASTASIPAKFLSLPLPVAVARSPTPTRTPTQQAYLQCSWRDGRRCYTLKLKGKKGWNVLVARPNFGAQQEHHHQRFASPSLYLGDSKWIYTFHDEMLGKGTNKSRRGGATGVGRWRRWMSRSNRGGNSRGCSRNEVASSTDVVGMMCVSHCRKPDILDGIDSSTNSCRYRRYRKVSEFVLYGVAQVGDGDEESRPVGVAVTCPDRGDGVDTTAAAAPTTPISASERGKDRYPSSRLAMAIEKQQRCMNRSSHRMHDTMVALQQGRKSSDDGRDGDWGIDFSTYGTEFSGGESSAIDSNRSSWSLDFWSDSEGHREAEEVWQPQLSSLQKELAAMVIEESEEEDEVGVNEAEDDAGGTCSSHGSCGWGLKFLQQENNNAEEVIHDDGDQHPPGRELKSRGGGVGGSIRSMSVCHGRAGFSTNTGSSTTTAVAGSGSRSNNRIMLEDNITNNSGNGLLQKKTDYMTLLLPAGVHGLPSLCGGEGPGEDGESHRPSSLIERWRSGGSCDCGGWDLGCGLRVCSSDRSPKHHESLYLFTQGSRSKEVMLNLSILEQGLLQLSFPSNILSPLAAFATAVAILHNNDQLSKPPFSSSSLQTGSNRQVEQQMPPPPPGIHQPIESVDHFTRAIVIPRPSQPPSCRQVAAAAGCGRLA